MHELTITEHILRLAVDAAHEAGASRVTRITLVIGELSSVVDDAVQLYFDLVSEGTTAAGALLEFKRPSATLRCPACSLTYAKTGARFACPACGGEGRLTGDAKECYIESIEVE